MIFNKQLFFTSNQMLQNRQKRNRFISWTIFYCALVVIFIYVSAVKLKAVNTKVIPTGSISLSIGQSQYTTGQPVSITLVNNLSSAVYFNNKCPQEPLNVYRWENNVWLRLHTTLDNSSCTDQTKTIKILPNESYNISYASFSQLFTTPGIYRVAALANNYNGLAFADFNIVAPPSKPVTPGVQIIYKNIYTPIYVNNPNQ